MKEELYEYVFKRALAEVDQLLNLAPAGTERSDNLIWARRRLLDAALTPPATPFKQPTKTEKESAPERSGGAVLGSIKSEVLAFEEYHYDPCTEEPGFMDFAGRWSTNNGARAEVTERRKDGGWDGTITGVGAAVWDQDGNHEEKGYTLLDRQREGTKNF